MLVHAQHVQCLARSLGRHATFLAHLRKIARPPQQPIGHARRPTTAPRDLFRAGVIHVNI